VYKRQRGLGDVYKRQIMRCHWMPISYGPTPVIKPSISTIAMASSLLVMGSSNQSPDSPIIASSNL
jgi:hypothetical protein